MASSQESKREDFGAVLDRELPLASEEARVRQRHSAPGTLFDPAGPTLP
jgi:hypothetical protein